MKILNNYLVLLMMMAFLIPSGTFAQVPMSKKGEVKKEMKVKEVKKTAESKKRAPATSDVKKHSSKTLKKGSKGQDVKTAQKALNSKGAKEEKTMIITVGQETKVIPKGPSSSDIKKHSSKTLKTGSKGEAKKADSNFGAGTKKGVKSFQKKKKLDADGIVGPKTKTKLEKKKGKKKKTLKKDQ